LKNGDLEGQCLKFLTFFRTYCERAKNKKSASTTFLDITQHPHNLVNMATKN